MPNIDLKCADNWTSKESRKLNQVCLSSKKPQYKPHWDFISLSKLVMNTASINVELITRQAIPMATLNGVTNCKRREIYRHAEVELDFFLSILFAIKTCFVSSIFSSFLSFLSRYRSFYETIFFWFFWYFSWIFLNYSLT